MASGGSGAGSPDVQQVVRYAFTVPGTLTTTNNTLIPWLPGQGDSVSKATGQMKNQPSGTAITVDILLIKRTDGSTTATLATLTILSGNLVGDITFALTPVDSDHALAINITQIGSISAGDNLTVVIT